MKENRQNTDELSQLIKNKYSTVYYRQNNRWIANGYVCKKCWFKIKNIGKLEQHQLKCRGKPVQLSLRGD